MAGDRTLFKKLASALFKGKDGAEEAPATASAVKSKEDETWVALALDDVLKKHPRARLQVVSLKEYRAAIGEAWATRSNTIRMLSESTIRSRLGQGESCLSQGDDVFLMLMPGADEKESAKRGYDTAVLLGQKLVGDKFTTGKVDGVVPQVRLANIAIADMVNGDGRVDVGAVLEAAKKAVSIKKIEGAMKSAPTPEATWDKAGRGKAGQDDWTSSPRGAKSGQDGWVAVKSQAKPQQADAHSVRQLTEHHKSKSDPVWAPISKEK